MPKAGRGDLGLLSRDRAHRRLCLAEQVLPSLVLATQKGLGPREGRTRTLEWGVPVDVGLAVGLGGRGQPGATLIWGLALASKLAASALLECPVMVGWRGEACFPSSSRE